MIKINLLEYRQAKKKIKVQKELFFMSLILFVSIGIIIIIAKSTSAKIEKLTDESNIIRAKINILKKSVRQVEDFEKNEKKLKEILEVIKLLKGNQTISVRILEEINKSIPPDIWLTNIKQTGRKINLAGYGFSNTEVARFMKNMELSNNIFNVELLETLQTTIGSEKINKFTLQFDIKI